MGNSPVDKPLGRITNMVVDQRGVTFEMEITDPDAYRALKDARNMPIHYRVEDDDDNESSDER